MSENWASAVSEHDNVVLRPFELFNRKNLEKKAWEILKCHKHMSVLVSGRISG